MLDEKTWVIKIKKDVREAFDGIAESYDRLRAKPWNVLTSYLKKMRLDEILEWGCCAADIGCGNGRNMLLLIEYVSRCVGVDISPKLIGIARKNAKKRNYLKNMSFLIADATMLPFRDGIFELGLSIAVIHHIPSFEERRKAVCEISRTLTKKGIAIISVWRAFQPKFLKELVKNLFRKIVGKCQELTDVLVPWRAGSSTYFRYYHLFTKREFEKLLFSANFTETCISKEDGPHVKIRRNFFAFAVK
ncbi:MAG: class I SAM-dependent methyltransferase [Candidatus Baldrarchaeia archaeon]